MTAPVHTCPAGSVSLHHDCAACQVAFRASGSKRDYPWKTPDGNVARIDDRGPRQATPSSREAEATIQIDDIGRAETWANEKCGEYTNRERAYKGHLRVFDVALGKLIGEIRRETIEACAAVCARNGHALSGHIYSKRAMAVDLAEQIRALRFTRVAQGDAPKGGT